MTKPFVVAVAGGSGSGKTTIVNLLRTKDYQSVLVFSQDHYYRDLSHLSPVERDKVNFDHPQSIDIDLMTEQLQMLVRGLAVEQPIYDFATHTRLPTCKRLESSSVILVDGILSLYFESLRHLAHLKLFVEVSDDIRFIRRLKRDISERGRTMDSVIEQYYATVRPMYKQYVEASKIYADFVIPWEERSEGTIRSLMNMLGF